MRVNFSRVLRMFETGTIRVWTVGDDKLGYCETGNTDAWICSEEPLTLREWR